MRTLTSEDINLTPLYIFFNRYQEDKEKDYMSIGLVIYIGIVFEAAFPSLIFKKLAGQPGVSRDLEEFDLDVCVALYPSCLIMARKL